MPKRSKRPVSPQPTTPAPLLTDPRQRLLADLAALRVAVTAEALDDVLAQAAQQGWSHLQFATRLLAQPPTSAANAAWNAGCAKPT